MPKLDRASGDVAALEAILDGDPILRVVLDRVAGLGVPGCYVAAGCIAGTVWNALHGFEPGSHIKDIDVVYFDASDLSEEAENSVAHRASELCANVPIPVDVKNQARVHLWYEDRFGRRIPPYRSAEDAIGTWPTTAMSVGVRRIDGGVMTCAPFGVCDLLEMVVRPNKVYVSREVYEAKARRWKRSWPNLRIEPWDAPSRTRNASA